MGVRSVVVMVVVTWAWVGCRPTAPADPPEPAPASAPATASAGTPADSVRARPEGSAPPASDLPDTCELELELLEPTGAHGKGTSDRDAKDAKDTAWAQACASLQQSHGIDCHDASRVAPIKEASQSIQARRGDGAHQSSYRFELELGLRRRAKGFGDAPGDRQEACRRAKAHACQELVQGPCPAKGLRVITVDGHPPQPASVEPRPATKDTRPTI